MTLNFKVSMKEVIIYKDCYQMQLQILRNTIMIRNKNRYMSIVIKIK